MLRAPENVSAVKAAPAVHRQRNADALSFRKLLQGNISAPCEVRLSAHAAERIRQRNIEFTQADMGRLSRAADKLSAKGGREALVVMDSVGVILDVKNRTVITAIERPDLQDNVFTNIDSAFFA